MATRELQVALARYDNPLFKFNAKVGDTWKCYLGLRANWTEYIGVELLEIQADAHQKRLFCYAVSWHPHASNFQAMPRVTVSPERDIVRMQWYEYHCWEGNCEDWIVQYAR